MERIQRPLMRLTAYISEQLYSSVFLFSLLVDDSLILILTFLFVPDNHLFTWKTEYRSVKFTNKTGDVLPESSFITYVEQNT